MKHITDKLGAILSLLILLILGLMLFRSADAQQQAEVSQETQDLMDALVLKIRVTAAAIHENETLAGDERALDYFVHIPSMNKLELGLELDISEPKNGFKVLSVSKDSPADNFGIEPNDLIVNVNHFEVNDANMKTILSEFQSLSEEDTLALMVKQNNLFNHITLTIDKSTLPPVNLYVGQHETTNSVYSPDSELIAHFDDSSKAFKKASKPFWNVKMTRINSSYDDGLDFSKYETFNFHSQTEISNPDFHEFLGLTFSTAIEQQMLSRGYVRSQNPDILINVSVDVEDKRSAPRRPESRICPSYTDYRSRKVSLKFTADEARGYVCQFTDGSIKIDMVDVEQSRKIWEGVSLVRIDYRERGDQLNLYIDSDVYNMFEGSPFHEPCQGTIVNDINKPVTMACWIPVHIYNIDGKNIQTSSPSFKVDQGKHLFKVRVNPGHRNPNCLAASWHFSPANIQRYRIEPFEIEVEAGKTYHIGLNAEDRIRKNWKVEVWKVY